jgi:hypothetical protein
MSRNIIFVLMYHRHELLDLVYVISAHFLTSVPRNTFIFIVHKSPSLSPQREIQSLKMADKWMQNQLKYFINR